MEEAEATEAHGGITILEGWGREGLKTTALALAVLGGNPFQTSKRPGVRSDLPWSPDAVALFGPISSVFGDGTCGADFIINIETAVVGPISDIAVIDRWSASFPLQSGRRKLEGVGSLPFFDNSSSESEGELGW